MQQEQEELSQEDQTYYFRQLCAYGEHYMSKITDLKIYIHGLHGLGVEVAKCLILSGVKHLTIQDDNLLEMKDLGSNAYCREENVGKKTRAAASIDLLRALNPRVSVQVNEFEVTERLLTEHDVVMITDFYDKKKLISFNKFCRDRETPIGFIYGGVLGLYGFVFVDFGKDFVVGEVNSEELEKNFIGDIKKIDSDCLEIRFEERFHFQEGDYVKFQEIEGMIQLNDQTHQVHSVDYSRYTIRIRCPSAMYGDYLHKGYAIQKKMPQNIQFDDFEASLNSSDFSSFLEADFSKFGQSEKLHQCLNGILNFYEIYQRLPELHNDKDAQEYSSICQGFDGEEYIPLNIAKYARVQLSSHCSFFGGMIAQEALKFTGKFTPLKQWLHYETFEIIPPGINNNVPLGSRFDDQIVIFGQEFQQNLENQKVLLIGVGTLGCELMKQFTLMGIGCGEKGKLTCVDSETVKPSNLSRQSLFKEKDIGRAKCQVACEAILNINPHMKVESKKLRIGSSEDKAWRCDEFWEEYDLVFCAVGNLKTREEIDKKCILYRKTMLDCGMSGAKASSQIIIPFKSQTYGESSDPYDHQAIPLDKLINFPSTMEDCVVRARDIIEQEFCQTTEYFLEFQKNPQKFIEQMKTDMTRLDYENFPYQLKALEKIICPTNITQETCLQYAAQIFDIFFYTRIKEIVTHFPPDHKQHGGQPFWNSRKKCPQPIVFDPKDEVHASFILSAANLYAKMFDLPLFTDKFTAALQATKLGPLRNRVFHNETSAQEFIKILESRDISSYPTVKSIEYSRENKLQLDLITATSIIRARNYSITEFPAYKINQIAGKFTPALITTATAITGALSFETFKLNHTNEIALMRNTCLNLEVPLFVFSEPAEPKKTTDKEYDPIFMGPTKVFPADFTAWDTIDIQGPLTVWEIVQHFLEKYGLKLSIIAYSSTILYNTFFGQGLNHCSLVPEEAFNHRSSVKEDFDGSKYLLLEASAEGTDDETEIMIPTIRYIRK